jgi:CRP-like cAMP-binding protein/Fe-S-cluster-containing dehydrogenase component
MSSDELGKTMLRQLELYHDRWSSLGTQTGLLGLSEQLTVEQLREFDVFREFDNRLLERIRPDVSLATWKQGAILFEEGTYIDLAFLVVEGQVDVYVRKLSRASATQPIFDANRTTVFEISLAGASEEKAPQKQAPPIPTGGTGEITFLASMDFDLPHGSSARLGPGEFFGEIGALSGWPQSVTARTFAVSRLLQIRLPALRLLKRKSQALTEKLDKRYRQRSLAAQLKGTPLFRGCTDVFVQALKEAVELVSCEGGEVIVEQGAPVDAFYLVRSGFVKLLQRYGEGELVVSYLSKGMTLGEDELLHGPASGWRVTAVSVENAELVRIPRPVFGELARNHPDIAKQLEATAADRRREIERSREHISYSEFTQVALEEGLVQGNSILAIDLNACTRCDDCVRACADTHGGRPRFVREGSKYDNLLIAKSCYHCRDPVCLVGCPTGAIHRSGVAAQVVIEEEICIGCATCFRNCPYDAIVMHDTGTVWPADAIPVGLRGKEQLVASKCDLCEDTGHGPACVSNCPQGCAYRVGSIEEFERLLEARD